jgi:hypothetical protein
MVLPVAMNPIDIFMTSINSNPYFIGIMMLLLNIGGRFLSLEVSKGQERFLSEPMVRRFLLFAVLFVATRNVLVAAGLTVIVIILLGYLFNENSDLCVFRSTAVKREERVETSSYGLSMEEIMILKRLQDKQAHAQKQLATKEQDSQKQPEKKKDPSAFDYYMLSINQISA